MIEDMDIMKSRDSNLPMHQYSSSGIQSFLNESIGRRKMLDDVLIGQVVYLDDKTLEMILILMGDVLGKRTAIDRDQVGDVSLVESIFSLEGT